MNHLKLLEAFFLVIFVAVGCETTSNSIPGTQEIQTNLPAATATNTLITAPTPQTEPFEDTDLILKFIADNGGCDFPCVWGLNPGESSLEQVQELLDKLSDNQKYYENQPVDGTDSLIATFSVVPSEYLQDFPYAEIKFYFEGGKVSIIWTYGFVAENYSLSSILNKYGVPDGIFLHTFNRVMYDRFINLYLYYENLGFIAQFYSPGELENGKITGCYNIASSIFTWSPEIGLTFQEANETKLKTSMEWFAVKSYFEATGETIESFYQNSINNDEKNCIETPSGIWPNQTD